MTTEEMMADDKIRVVVEEALDDTGYVLSVEVALTTTDGQAKKATATYYLVYGINVRSTKDMDGAAQADKEVAVKKTGMYRVQLAPNASRTTAIEKGDLVGVIDAGKIGSMIDSPAYTDLGTPTNAKINKYIHAIVGKAEEAIGAGADTDDGKLLVSLGLP